MKQKQIVSVLLSGVVTALLVAFGMITPAAAQFTGQNTPQTNGGAQTNQTGQTNQNNQNTQNTQNTQQSQSNSSTNGTSSTPQAPNKGGKGTCAGEKTDFFSCSGNGQDAIVGLLKIIITGVSVGVGVIAVGGLVYGAILYASAQDNQEQVQKSIRVVRAVVAGLLLYIFMVAIINFLVPGGVFNNANSSSGTNTTGQNQNTQNNSNNQNNNTNKNNNASSTN